MDKQYNHQEIEKEIQALWEKLQPYAFDEKGHRPVYSIDTPPPTVSGSLHIGHIFSYTQTDVVARYKRLCGCNVFYPMGFDNNGLATERFVEKKHSIRGHMLKRSEFIALCLKESEAAVESFVELWKAIGLSIDWTKRYSTISPKAQKISQRSFLELYNKGLVYKTEEPALYCTTCRTTVAQAELDDAEVSSSFNDIVFKLGERELQVATTRPELLPACVALFYHPDDERYRSLAGKKAIVPVFNHEVPILADVAVNKEKGTGLVMCCTFGDHTDVTWYKTHKLPWIQVVGRDGVWMAAGPLTGLRVHDARKKALELLQEAGLLRNQKPITHHVNVHERCKQEIEYLILNQWFVKILHAKKEFIALADQIAWKPEFMKARYKDWVEHLGWDWCISRQRFFGIPFPVWHCESCKAIILADEKMLPVDPQETPCGKCPKCSGTQIVPDTDVMDTWNTSSLTPQINTNWNTEKNISLPMSLRPQAHDIIRTWTFYTIVKSFYHHKCIPWKEVAISGYVVAQGKEKISKSKGNAPTDPENLLKTYSADSIRYWAANGRLGIDTLFSENQFKIGQRLLIKLWNAFRFCKEHIDAHQPGNSEAESGLDDLNRWILHNFGQTVVEYKKHFEAYDYTFALEAAEKFFWQFFCDNYLELVKDRIFNPDKYGKEVIDATRYTLYEVGFGLLQLFAPFVPHITEKIYQLLYVSKESVASLHNTVLHQERFTYDFIDQVPGIDCLVAVVGAVRKLKSENKMSLKVELAQLAIHCPNKTFLTQLQQHEVMLKAITGAHAVSYVAHVGESKLVEKDGTYTAEVSI